MNQDITAQLNDMQRRLARAEAKQRTTARLALLAFVCGLVGAAIWSVPVALAGPPTNPFACDETREDWYCFFGGRPARADEINSNFELLHQTTDALTTSLASSAAQLQQAMNASVATRLPSAGGTITGNLAVNGSLSVGAGLPIAIHPTNFTAETYSSAMVDMTPVQRSVCFLVSTGTYFTSNAVSQAHPSCAIHRSGAVWRLFVNGTPTTYQTCYARCISW